MFNLSNKRPLRTRARRLTAHQTGGTLIEMLIGIAVGLLVVTAAVGTMVVSRVTALSITDQLELQQQANTAMRIMANHLRETNTRELEISTVPGAVLQQVIFSPFPVYTGSAMYLRGLARDANGNDSFGLAYADAGPPNQTVDCLGNTATPFVVGASVVNTFSVVNNQLQCQGTTAAGAQPIIDNVERMRVLYAFQDQTVTPPTLRYLTQALAPAAWANTDLLAVEICLELAAPTRGIGIPPGQYTDCDGVSRNFDTRMRAIVRQTIRLRTTENLL
jgi:type IV pilus assembly protein PilW